MSMGVGAPDGVLMVVLAQFSYKRKFQTIQLKLSIIGKKRKFSCIQDGICNTQKVHHLGGAREIPLILQGTELITCAISKGNAWYRYRPSYGKGLFLIQNPWTRRYERNLIFSCHFFSETHVSEDNYFRKPSILTHNEKEKRLCLSKNLTFYKYSRFRTVNQPYFFINCKVCIQGTNKNAPFHYRSAQPFNTINFYVNDTLRQNKDKLSYKHNLLEEGHEKNTTILVQSLLYFTSENVD